MNIGVIRESNPLDRRVALTPPVVRHLAERGHTVWVESGAGAGAKFRDDEYISAGASVAYSSAEVIQRCELIVKVSSPALQELDLVSPNSALMAFYHLAVVGRAPFEKLIERAITAIGCEIIETEDGRLPVLAAISEIAGQMVIPVAAHLLRSSSGGRGILVGGSPGTPPAHIVILGAGSVGRSAARTAAAAGARVTVLDTDPEKLHLLIEHGLRVETSLAESESVASAVASADVVVGAVLVAGRKSPHVVTKQMVENMRPGSAVIDLAIDQGGCVETSRPTTLDAPTFLHQGVLHYCVPNMTADMGRSTSVALAQAALPYLLELAGEGIEGALLRRPDLARGVYTHRGVCVHAGLAKSWQVPCHSLGELFAAGHRGR